MSTIVPDVWAVIEFKFEDKSKSFRKILAGWNGSLERGSICKLSSELKKTVEQEDKFIFTTISGNKCICYKDREDNGSFSQGWIQKYKTNIGKNCLSYVVKYVKEKQYADPSANTEPQPTFTEKLKQVFSFLKK